MHLNTDGLVVTEKSTGESDRIVTLLTRDYGIIRAFVRGAKSVKNKNQSGTSIFAYSKFSIYRGRDAYIVDDAVPIEVFYKLRENLEFISLAQYFCELVTHLAPEETPAEEHLSVMLNSLYLLSNGKRPQPFLKAVTELRLMSISGYMPRLLACDGCGKYSDDVMYFDSSNGLLHCTECSSYGIPINAGILTAMRHICLTEPKKIFSFSLPDDSLRFLASVSEDYVSKHIDKKFKTLSFYNSLKEGF